MVVFYNDEQADPEIRKDADTSHTLRRTSARIKTIEAKNEKRTTPAPATPMPAKMDHQVKKRSFEKPPQLEDLADADVSDAVATISIDVSETEATTSTASAMGKGVHAQVTDTLRAFNKHYLHFIQEEENRVARLEADKERNMKKGSKDRSEEYANSHLSDRI